MHCGTKSASCRPISCRVLHAYVRGTCMMFQDGVALFRNRNMKPSRTVQAAETRQVPFHLSVLSTNAKSVLALNVSTAI
jgi:hypothetical protein